MWESTHNFTFADENFIFWCRPNDTRIYYNITDPQQCAICNATFAADPDIAGVGIITSFAGMSLCTIAVAFIPAYYDTVRRQKERLRDILARGTVPNVPPPHTPDPRSLMIAKRLLGNLCDLQIFTATAVITAAFAQGESLAFYHQAFVVHYWYLTLNSYWAARHVQDEEWNTEDKLSRASSHPEPIARPNAGQASRTGISDRFRRCDAWVRGQESFRSWLRRLVVLFCTITFVIFNSFRLWLEDYSGQWDPFVSGRCYISHDKAVWWNEWLWLAGVSFYALCLLASLVSNKMKTILLSYATGLHRREDKLAKACVKAWREVAALRTKGFSIAAALFLLYSLALSFFTLVYCAFGQFAAIWSSGAGIYAVEVAFYMGMWAWDFYDVVDLKASNLHLVTGSETAWGFGQVLAVVLMGMVVLNLVDAVADTEERDLDDSRITTLERSP